MIKHLLLEREKAICIIYAVFSTIISDIRDRIFPLSSLFSSPFLTNFPFQIHSEHLLICWNLVLSPVWKSYISSLCASPGDDFFKHLSVNEYIRFDYRSGWEEPIIDIWVSFLWGGLWGRFLFSHSEVDRPITVFITSLAPYDLVPPSLPLPLHPPPPCHQNFNFAWLALRH